VTLGIVAILGLGASRGALGAEADLVADINTLGMPAAGYSTFGEDAAVLGGLYVYVADDSVTGREPWALDLVTGETERLADIHPGPAGSSPRDFVPIGAALLFVATSPEAGEELWMTDGTAAGTALVEDLFAGPTGSAIFDLRAVPGDRAVFRADDGVAGAEPWVSDGTAAGTFRLADIHPGPTGSVPSGFVWAGSQLLFRASDATSGAELWKWSSGTVSRVADLEPGAGSSYPAGLFAVGSQVYFQACRTSDGCELWRSNGTAAGTIRLADLDPTGSSSPTGLFWHPGLARLFFTADDGIHGRELWQWSGGVATRLTDLNPGSADSDPTALGALPAKLTFVADDGGSGSRLFAFDGAGVTQVKSLSSAGVPGMAGDATAWNGRVYFLEGASSCWYTDGSSAGTVKWTTCLSTPALLLGGNRVLYGRSDAGEREIWSIDASDATSRESDFASFSSQPREFTFLGETAFFSADDGVAGRELWISDGTAAGTFGLDLEPGADASNPSDFELFAGEIWFAAETAATGAELWRSDGTPGGTVVRDFVPGPDGSRPDQLTVAGSYLYFAADDPALGAQLFRIAGPTSPPERLDVNGESGLYPEKLTPLGARLFFFGETGATGVELFVVDAGVSEPTALEVVAGPDGPGGLEELGVHGDQIWRSDGTSVERVTSLTSGNAPGELTAGPGGVYFVHDEPATGSEVWRTDGTQTARITDIHPLDGDAWPSELTAAGGRLWLRADDGSSGYELWWTDGSTAALAGDLLPGPDSSLPAELTAAGERLVFAASGGSGQELWLADLDGVRPLPEVWPGVGDANPEELAVDPGATRVLFSAIGPEVWREPFRIDLLLLFADGFENGDAGAWSSSAP